MVPIVSTVVNSGVLSEMPTVPASALFRRTWRISSLVADEVGVAGLVCLGYPFHPVGKPDRLRVEHLRTIKTPTLIMQGERDGFGNREEVAGYKVSPAIEVNWVADGDHSFKP